MSGNTSQEQCPLKLYENTVLSHKVLGIKQKRHSRNSREAKPNVQIETGSGKIPSLPLAAQKITGTFTLTENNPKQMKHLLISEAQGRNISMETKMPT